MRATSLTRSSRSLVAALLGMTSAAGAQEITYAKNVAPIIESKCQVCHQPNSIAPMPLMKYEDVQQYADEIRSYVSDRVMPPWQLDKTTGIQSYKNDRGLSNEQIATIVQWMDAGMKRGDAKDA